MALVVRKSFSERHFRYSFRLRTTLAKFLRKEDVVTFSTGFQSNLGIISAVVGFNDYIVCDKENHASIYDGAKLSYGRLVRYEHGDMEDLEAKLAGLDLERFGAIIITDGVFSMSGDIAKLPDICRLAKKYGARVMVDDAHGLGVLGKGGRGTAEHLALKKKSILLWGLFLNRSLVLVAIWRLAKNSVIMSVTPLVLLSLVLV